MVTVLPQKTNVGTDIGRAMGQGFTNAFEPVMQQQYQRGMMQNALKGLDNIPKNASPVAIAKQLLSATAGLPDQGRIMSALYGPMIQQSQAQALTNMGGPEAGDSQGTVFSPGVQQKQKANETIATNDPMAFLESSRRQNLDMPDPSVTPDIFQGTLEPTSLGMGPIPKTYSPEQIMQMRNEDLARGLTSSARAEAAEKYNDLSRSRTQDMVQAASVQYEISEKAAQRQQEFRKELENQTGITDPSDLAVAESIANRPEFKNISNDRIRAEKVAKEYNLYAADRDAFARGSTRPNPILSPVKYQSQMDNNKTKAANLIKYGQRDKAYEILAKNGWSENEIAKQLNPLDQGTKDILNSLPKISKGLGLPPNASSQLVGKIEQERSNALKVWENAIPKVIKPGSFDPKQPDVFIPGTSLILLRNEAQKQGMGSIAFDNMVSRMVESGKIKLDPYQQREYQMLSEDPTRVWNISELIFGG